MKQNAWTPSEVELLRKRARNLARTEVLPVTRATVEPTLLVGVSGEQCAIPMAIVRGVARLKHLSPLPRVRPEVAGLFAWGGQLHVAFHLRSVLAIPLSTLPEGASVVLVGDPIAEAGLVVDFLYGTLDVDVADLLPTPERFSPRGRQLLRGVTPAGVPVIDREALLSSPALYVRPPSSFGVTP